MAVTNNSLVFSSNLLSGQINELNVQAEINTITSEIKTLLGSIDAGAIIDSSLQTRISQCIAILEAAKEELSAKNTVVAKFKAVQSITIARDGAEALVAAQEALNQAQIALNQAKARVSSNYTRRQIRLAILEGYAIVTILREQLTGETIDYKIMTMGEDGEGNDVLFSAQPTLAQVLSSASLDTKTFSLRITATQHQFQKLLVNMDAAEPVIGLRNSILKQMQVIQLDSAQADMWATLKKIQASLSQIEGAFTNYGQLAESFMEYYFIPPDGLEDTVEYIYSLLEKGRNNLAYYLGADINTGQGGLWQVKALSVYGSRGRADVATLTNVLTPLKEILRMITNIQIVGKQALIDYFQPHSATQGDRPFSEKLETKVKNAIRQALKEIEQKT